MSLHRTPEQEIASDQLDRLEENPDRCAWLSVHAGRHPWVRYSPERQSYEIVEVSGVGNLEVEGCEKGGLLNLFAENPVDEIPLSDATFSPPKPGQSNVFEAVEQGSDCVIYADGNPYSKNEPDA